MCITLSIYVYTHMGFPGSSAGKESTYDAGDLGQSLGWEILLEKG